MGNKKRKYFFSINIKRIKRLFLSKSFIGSILFAAALWGYTSLNHEYTPFVKVPLTVKLPWNQAVENILPNYISIKVKGGGWQIFYLMFFNTTKRCSVDLSGKGITGDEYIISRTDILKGIQNIVDVEPIDVFPETMKLKIGRLATIKVPVFPNVVITPRDGFIASSKTKLFPDSIEITGNETVIRSIKFWNTKNKEIDNLFHTSLATLYLSDSLKSIVKLSQKTVTIQIEIQQSADITIYDIPVQVRGGMLPKNHKLRPGKINVTVHGGIDEISTITKYDIMSYVSYDDIINDSTGIIKPRIEVKDGLNKYYSHPQYIYHFKTFNSHE